jgi:putative sigma-54 modulation protein
MQLQVKGKNLDVTDALFDHAEEKMERIVRVLPPWDEGTVVELELSVERNPKIDRPQVAEATLRTKGPVLRARESAPDMYQAIDQAAKKLERQARRYRDRRKSHGHERIELPELPPAPEDGEAAQEPIPRVVKRKAFTLLPMSADEAAFNMDLLHHDFYVFRDAESGEVNVVYRRRDGDVGLIVPEPSA